MKIGIAGCGSIAKTHMNAILSALSEAEIFFYDIDQQKAEEIRNVYSAGTVFDDFDDLLSRIKLDTVHILTPVDSHFSMAEKCLDNGIHVYIEKPVTETAAEFNELAGKAEEKGKIIFAGYSALGMPAIMKAKEIIDSGRLGRMVSVHCDFLCAWPGNTIPYGDPDHWAYSLQGGVLQNMADHPASMIIDVLDTVQHNHSSVCKRNILPSDCPDLMHMTVRSDDQVGSFTLSLGHGVAQRRISYYLEGGMIMADAGSQLVSIVKGKGPQNFIKKILSGMGSGWDLGMGSVGNVFKVIRGKLKRNPGIMNLVENFYDAVQGKKDTLIKPDKAREIITVLEDAWKHSESIEDIHE